MAIVWSDEYPGQVSVDPGWPHGKPRNVAVPGDGSGTPLEAAWVSDLAGWQAALLLEAGITPSGNPDQIGASDYTEAIKKISQVEFSNFTSEEHTWTASQKFTSGYFEGDLGVGGEVRYANPTTGALETRTRTLRIPPNLWMAECVVMGQSAEPAWLYRPTSLGMWYGRSMQPGWFRRLDVTQLETAGLYAEVPLPSGGQLVSVKAKVQCFSDSPPATHAQAQMSVGLSAIEDGFINLRTAEVATPLGDNTDSELDIIAATHLPWLGPMDGSLRTILVRFTGTALCAVSWVQVSFTDPGPRNF